MNAARSFGAEKDVTEDVEIPFEPTKAQVRVLAEAGFTAIRRNQFGAAKEIFTGLQAFQPRATATLVGLALVMAAEGRHASAITTLKEARAAIREPDPMITAFQGLISLLAGDAADCIAALESLPRPASAEDEALFRELNAAAARAILPTSTAWRKTDRKTS